MTGCRFPQHHQGARGSGGPGALAVAALAVAVFLAVRAAEAVAAFLAEWWPVLVAVPAVLLAGGIVARMSGRHLPGWLRYAPLALWAMVTWRSMCRRLGLVSRGRPGPGRARHPLALAYPSRYGITVRSRTVAGVDREAVEKQAEHFRHHLRCARLTVTEPGPGRFEVRALRADPLTAPLAADILPPFDGRHVTLGRDERGILRTADLGNLSGSAWSGAPGRGKTEGALSLACQLAASPLVDWWILDGGACDWAPFADGAAGYVGDDLAAAEDMLRVLDAKMGERRRNLQADRGVRNGWTLGPAEDYPLQWVLVEEAPFYLDADAVKGDRKLEGHVRACRGLLAGILRRGRAPLFHTSLIAQKGTGTGGLPPDLRDLCGLRWSFGLPTTEASAAILGDDIRKHETLSPTLLQGAGHVGVASVLMRTGHSPYTLLRFPEVGQDRADQLAVTLAPRPLMVPPVAPDPEPELDPLY